MPPKKTTMEKMEEREEWNEAADVRAKAAVNPVAVVHVPIAERIFARRRRAAPPPGVEEVDEASAPVSGNAILVGF
ncbi:uncharacterized protein RHO25_002273 [Cercospora beticola]|uniref:Uncharacterized protein n=1 Tax=Cercospora beticola TaxID=122368 RepID=A0ABZ0NDP8_CERBT|nr:hypothetical protein RHO25_002273 [Cercospora beticola]